jgi:hypothetical protein
LDDKFRVYLQGVFRATLYGLGEQLYEGRKELVTGEDALASKKAYLKELDQLAEELSARAVAELEKLGIDSADDLLSKQGLVKGKLGAVQTQLEKELGAK